MVRIPTVDDYDAVRSGFDWEMPALFNIAAECVDRHPATDLALVEVGSDGDQTEYTFGELSELSNRFGNALRALGVARGDRVGVVLPQRVETGISHLATYKLGAIAVPLSPLFGPQALRYRLSDSGAKVVVTDSTRRAAVDEAVAGLPGLEVVLVDDRPGRDARFWRLVAGSSPLLDALDTTPDDPALIIYTSGTTGPPKGALHGHRVLLGHLPGFDLMFDRFPQPGDRSWTPADWAWIGGLLDLLLPTWYHGRPVVGALRTGAFEADWAVSLMSRCKVTTAFLPPSALRLLRQADVDMLGGPLRTVMSGGESLGSELLSWARAHLGVDVNEIYGQTEANLVVGNSHQVWPIRLGSMGRPYPGHDISVLGPDGRPAADGVDGEIAVRMPDPVGFLGYWNNADATARKVVNGWLHTGDVGRTDPEGYLWFTARRDDVINSAGYRIGPGEIEECIETHPAVFAAVAIGVPDDLRGQVVKAYVVLADGYRPSVDLENEIRSLVRHRLAAYEYPREIQFLDELPTTATGKVRRVALRQQDTERPSNASPAG